MEDSSDGLVKVFTLVDGDEKLLGMVIGTPWGWIAAVKEATATSLDTIDGYYHTQSAARASVKIALGLP